MMKATCNKKYSSENLKKALSAVREHGLTVYEAAKRFSIPRTTLRDKINGKLKDISGNPGMAPFLSKDEEKELLEYFQLMNMIGFPFSRNEIIEIGSDYVVEKDRKPHNFLLSYRWLYSFQERWPELPMIRKGFSCHLPSLMMPCIINYYRHLRKIFDEHGLSDKPHRIFFMEQIALDFNHYSNENDDESNVRVSIVGSGNANGDALPPYVTFPCQRIDSSLIHSGPPGMGLGSSLDGWLTTTTLKAFLLTHFLSFVTCDDDSFVLLLYDAHVMRCSAELQSFAREHNIILLPLPHHSHHQLSPLSAGSFTPLHEQFFEVCQGTIRRNNSMSLADVCPILAESYQQATSPENIKNSFSRTSIYPFSFVQAEHASLLCAYHTIKDFKNYQSVRLSGGSIVIKADESNTLTAEKTCRKSLKKGRGNLTKSKRKCGTVVKLSASLIDECRFDNAISPIANDNIDDDKETLCCICDSEVPPQIATTGTVSESDMIRWAQCDECEHWVHLQFCSPISFVGESDIFLCPTCQ